MFQFGQGSQRQQVRLLPAISLAETYPINTLGCQIEGYEGGIKACSDKRGALYDFNRSTTAELIGHYAIDKIEAYNSYNFTKQAATFMYDTMTLGWPRSAGSEQASIDHTMFALLASTDFSIVGQFGLRPQPTNFSDMLAMNGGQDNYLLKLQKRSLISSLSYGYTAGAYYR